MISLHSFLIHVIGNSIVCIPISVLKTSVVIRSDLKLGPTVAVCYFMSMCFILILVHLQFVAGMSAMLDVFVVRYQCCLNLTWEGFGIMLMTLTGWFDLVLGSDVTM